MESEANQEIEQPKKKDFLKEIKKLYASKRPLFIGGIIGIVVLIIIIGSVIWSMNKSGSNYGNTASNSRTYYASLTFTPAQIVPVVNKLESASIFLDVGSNTAGIVTFTIKFDPKVIQSFDIRQQLDPTSALSNSFAMKDTLVKLDEGYAKTTLLLKPQAAEQIGSGKVAQIFFVVKPDFVGNSPISIMDVSINSKTVMGKGRYNPQVNTLTITRNK